MAGERCSFPQEIGRNGGNLLPPLVLPTMMMSVMIMVVIMVMEKVVVIIIGQNGSNLPLVYNHDDNQYDYQDYGGDKLKCRHPPSPCLTNHVHNDDL